MGAQFNFARARLILGKDASDLGVGTPRYTLTIAVCLSRPISGHCAFPFASVVLNGACGFVPNRRQHVGTNTRPLDATRLPARLPRAVAQRPRRAAPAQHGALLDQAVSFDERQNALARVKRQRTSRESAKKPVFIGKIAAVRCDRKSPRRIPSRVTHRARTFFTELKRGV